MVPQCSALDPAEEIGRSGIAYVARKPRKEEIAGAGEGKHKNRGDCLAANAEDVKKGDN